MWDYIKKGFGYSFGGRIGWELGGFVWNLLRKLITIIFAGMVMKYGMTGHQTDIHTQQQQDKPAIHQHHQPQPQ